MSGNIKINFTESTGTPPPAIAIQLVEWRDDTLPEWCQEKIYADSIKEVESVFEDQPVNSAIRVINESGEVRTFFFTDIKEARNQTSLLLQSTQQSADRFERISTESAHSKTFVNWDEIVYLMTDGDNLRLSGMLNNPLSENITIPFETAQDRDDYIDYLSHEVTGTPGQPGFLDILETFGATPDTGPQLISRSHVNGAIINKETQYVTLANTKTGLFKIPLKKQINIPETFPQLKFLMGNKTHLLFSDPDCTERWFSQSENPRTQEPELQVGFGNFSYAIPYSDENKLTIDFHAIQRSMIDNETFDTGDQKPRCPVVPFQPKRNWDR
ncbi:MAG: hypothetical protein H6868_01710 [Rhodospirillales bacterium]|nr:hypothetical protein [Rhodospirillales bacterium]